MIKFLDQIYPDESVYSYLCRLYTHSGFVCHRGFANTIFARWNENPEYNFINPLSKEFRDMLERFIPYKELLLEHTLFTYYARFLPKEKRIRAYEYALTNEALLRQYLPITQRKNEHYLSYCPKCVEEDREKYGECYFHIQHLIPSVHVCPIHNCELVDTVLPNKGRCATLIPLEQIISTSGVKTSAEYEETNINIMVAKYINEVIHQPLNMDTDILISDYLTVKLKDEYVSIRGERRNLVELNRDMTVYFDGLDSYDITKQQLSSIFKNDCFTPYKILLVAKFENITPKDLCSYIGYVEPRHVTFDRRARELSQQGKNYNEIGRIMGICHEVISQIIKGTYDKPKRQGSYSPYRTPRWDWEIIDDNCCKEFNSKLENYIASNPKAIISRRIVGELFDLKDKSLRNLPRLQQMIMEYKKINK